MKTYEYRWATLYRRRGEGVILRDNKDPFRAGLRFVFIWHRRFVVCSIGWTRRNSDLGKYFRT